LKIRVLLADDHVLIRECIGSILKKYADLQVVAETDNGLDAVRLALDLLPDVVLLDADMKEVDGIEATHRIVRKCPNVKVLILSARKEHKAVAAGLKAGANGFLLKTCTSKEIVAAIRAVAGNGFYLSPGLKPIAATDGPGGSTLLTCREREILVLLAEGKKTSVIAVSLQISQKTVESHRLQVMKKLDFDNVADLTRFALREKMLPLD